MKTAKSILELSFRSARFLYFFDILGPNLYLSDRLPQDKSIYSPRDTLTRRLYFFYLKQFVKTLILTFRKMIYFKKLGFNIYVVIYSKKCFGVRFSASALIFSRKPGYASVQPFLYFVHFHIFGLFCTSTHRP